MRPRTLLIATLAILLFQALPVAAQDGAALTHVSVRPVTTPASTARRIARRCGR